MSYITFLIRFWLTAGIAITTKAGCWYLILSDIHLNTLTTVLLGITGSIAVLIGLYSMLRQLDKYFYTLTTPHEEVSL